MERQLKKLYRCKKEYLFNFTGKLFLLGKIRMAVRYRNYKYHTVLSNVLGCTTPTFIGSILRLKTRRSYVTPNSLEL